MSKGSGEFLRQVAAEVDAVVRVWERKANVEEEINF